MQTTVPADNAMLKLRYLAIRRPIKIITEKKLKIIDDLQRQVNVLSQRPDADSIDEVGVGEDTFDEMCTAIIGVAY